MAHLDPKHSGHAMLVVCLGGPRPRRTPIQGPFCGLFDTSRPSRAEHPVLESPVNLPVERLDLAP